MMPPGEKTPLGEMMPNWTGLDGWMGPDRTRQDGGSGDGAGPEGWGWSGPDGWGGWGRTRPDGGGWGRTGPDQMVGAGPERHPRSRGFPSWIMDLVLAGTGILEGLRT